MDYYIASEQGPLGPYSIEQLIERRVKADDMVWRNGLPEWTRVDQLSELEGVLNAPDPVVPPTFNRERYNAANYSFGSRQHPEIQQYNYPDDEECPPTYRWLAIIAFLGIIPCAIVALIKSVMVTRLWEEGNRDAARYQSRKALMWGLIGALIGIPLSIYIMFFSDQSMMANDLLQQFM